jgi:hypothetical protein
VGNDTGKLVELAGATLRINGSESERGTLRPLLNAAGELA